jgi:hypothetical protein
LATSKNLPQGGGRGEEEATPDIRAIGITTIPVEAGGDYCGDNDSFQWIFGINTWERQELLDLVDMIYRLEGKFSPPT